MDRKRRCPLCGTSADSASPASGGYRICRACDVAWRVVEDSADPAGDWERHYYAQDKIRELHERRISGLEALARRITDRLPARGVLLDVGAGVGIFMEAMARAGWTVEGIEPSGIAVAAARQRTGAPVHLGLLEEVELRPAYDAITFFDALRTVPDPMRFLRAARSLLRPGGVLVLREVDRKVELGRERLRELRRTPQEPGRRAFVYRQVFSPRSLLFALDRAGFTQAWVEPSPVFAEPDAKHSLARSLLKRSLGAVTASAYALSGRRLVIGPNLLAFGKAPDA